MISPLFQCAVKAISKDLTALKQCMTKEKAAAFVTKELSNTMTAQGNSFIVRKHDSSSFEYYSKIHVMCFVLA